MKSVLLVLLLITAIYGHEDRLQVMTVATSETDGYERFMRSVRLFGIDVEVVGMGVEWQGGDVIKLPGGGHKVNLIRPVVERWKDESNTIVMFVDSYDVIFTAGANTIIQKFKDFDSRVVFSAEGFCWPDASLVNQYPKVALGKRFLNSGGFIGYASDIYSLVWDHKIEDTDDDQLYFTQLYLDQQIREKHSIRLDHRAHIFQNLNGAQDEVALVFQSNETFLLNSIYNTRAAVYHGNGPSKVFLNSLGNYMPNAWNESEGCIVCKEWIQELPEDPEALPTVLIALFVEQPTPFLQDVLERIYKLEYPKSKLYLWVHNGVAYHEDLVKAWFNFVSSDYKASQYLGSEDKVREADARVLAMKQAMSDKYDYFFTLDSVVMLDSADALKNLLQIKRNVVTPMLSRPKKLYSNFWGDVAANGFYARSHDYISLVENQRRGIWNVPFVMNAVVFSVSWLQSLGKDLPNYHTRELDSDMSFTYWMRRQGHFMYVTNLHSYGHLINEENFETNHVHNDMYNIFQNRKDWERRYLHENYSEVLDEEYFVEQPCPDVYWYPLISETFANELIEELEHFGKWSAGNNQDDRLDGGYENVPTRDIHMNQVGFEEQWLNIIQTYVVPIQLKVFPGYYSSGRAVMNFVVKYWPEGQHSLRPHHDSSTFTINVALSTPGVDFEGGGCRFLRYNCSVTIPRLGWTFMHPGRLTHYHEGLRVTKGTRYIMVSFIDP